MDTLTEATVREWLALADGIGTEQDPVFRGRMMLRLTQDPAFRVQAIGSDMAMISQETLTRLCDQLEQVRAALPLLAASWMAQREALHAALEWMAEEGCDCGTEEHGTCGLCLVEAALGEEATQ